MEKPFLRTILYEREAQIYLTQLK